MESRRRLSYLPALDGVRALAVLGVVLGHSPSLVFEGGWLGVDIFFVLSGFLITRNLREELAQTGHINLKRFYTRRAARLMPGLVLVVAVTALLAVALRPTGWGDTLRWGVPGSLLYINAELRLAHLGPQQLLGHTWSLSVEEHFYLIFPLLLLLAHRRAPQHVRSCVLGLAALGVMYSMWLPTSGADIHRLWYGPDWRAQQILAGCVLAYVLPSTVTTVTRKNIRSWHLAGTVATAVCLAWLFVFYNIARVGTRVFYAGLGSMLVAATAAVMIGYVVLLAQSPIARLFTTKPAKWLGTRSYSVYLWHYPLIFLLYALYGKHWSCWIVGVALALLAAEASYRFVERPVRHWAIERLHA